MLNKLQKEFDDYTKDYLKYYRCELKYNHSYRVMELSKIISESISLSEDDIELSQIIGLLHDIGRFDQFKYYNSFVDINTIDHGDLGVYLLKKDNNIRNYIIDSKYDNIIYNAIRNHNKFIIDSNLDDRELLFSKIIRDADKIDIMYLYVVGELGNKRVEDNISDDIVECIKKNKLIDSHNIKNLADKMMIVLCFPFDFNYSKSFDIIYSRGYIDKIIDNYINVSFDNTDYVKELNNIRNIINEYILSHISK